MECVLSRLFKKNDTNDPSVRTLHRLPTALQKLYSTIKQLLWRTFDALHDSNTRLDFLSTTRKRSFIYLTFLWPYIIIMEKIVQLQDLLCLSFGTPDINIELYLHATPLYTCHLNKQSNSRLKIYENLSFNVSWFRWTVDKSLETKFKVNFK